MTTSRTSMFTGYLHTGVFTYDGLIRDPKQAREFEELFARQLAAYDDESDALKLPKLSTLGNIFSFAAPVVGGIIDHFKNKYVNQPCIRIP